MVRQCLTYFIAIALGEGLVAEVDSCLDVVRYKVSLNPWKAASACDDPTPRVFADIVGQ